MNDDDWRKIREASLTALMRAARDGDLAQAEQLLSQGADLEAKDKEGKDGAVAGS